MPFIDELDGLHDDECGEACSLALTISGRTQTGPPSILSHLRDSGAELDKVKLSLSL